jgi:hypothetical protein
MSSIPKIWQDGTVYIIGGGPSVIEQFGIPEELVQQVRTKKAPMSEYAPYFSALHNKHVIGVNAAYMLGEWVDVCFFGDNTFFEQNQAALRKYKGLKYSCHKLFKNERFRYENIHYIPRSAKKTGLSKTEIVFNYNSGAAAINLACLFGAKKVVLLGFDMALTNAYQHWHNHYTKKGQPLTRGHVKGLPFKRHLSCFNALAEDAKKLELEIINTSMNSKIEQFQKLPIQEVL